MGRAIVARPKAAASPIFKLTEQGEVIFARYGSLAIAERHIEQVVHALLLSCVRPAPAEASADWVAIAGMTAVTLLGGSTAAYR